MFVTIIAKSKQVKRSCNITCSCAYMLFSRAANTRRNRNHNTTHQLSKYDSTFFGRVRCTDSSKNKEMGLTSSFFFFVLLSSPSASPAAFLFPSCADFWDCRNSAIKSGQSRLSSGSHVLSSLQKQIQYSCVLIHDLVTC